MPNRWRFSGLIARQLERLLAPERQALLTHLSEQSPGLWGLVDLADDALRAKRDPSKAPKAMLDFEPGFPDALAKTVGKRLDQASLIDLLSMPDLDFIVHRWSQWGDVGRIREVFKPMLDDDNRLLELIDKFVRTGLLHSGNKTTETYQLSMKPLASIMDVQAMEPRIRALQNRVDLTARQRAAISRFILGLQRMAEGKDPDGHYLDDSND